MVQLSPIVTSAGCISSMYTSWPIQTFLPITTPRNRCSHGRKLNPPGVKKAILPTSLLSRSGKINGSYLSFHDWNDETLIHFLPTAAQIVFARQFQGKPS